MTALEDRDALCRLEDEPMNFEGLANCLLVMGMSPSNDKAFVYLGGPASRSP